MPSAEEDIEDYDDCDIKIVSNPLGMILGKKVKPQIPVVEEIDSGEEELDIEFDLQDKVIEVEGKRRLMNKKDKIEFRDRMRKQEIEFSIRNFNENKSAMKKLWPKVSFV